MSIINFFNCKKKSDKNEELKSANNITSNNRYKAKFNRYRYLIESNSHEKKSVATYIMAIIVEYLNYREAVQSLECEHNPQNNSLLEAIYDKIETDLYLKHNIFIFDKIHDEDKKYYNSNEIVGETPLEIDINKYPILLNPWNGNRLIDNLLRIIDEKIILIDYLIVGIYKIISYIRWI